MSDGKTRVLLVEDNAADARLLRELLAEVPRRPFDLTCAATLTEGIAAFAGHDAVLLDLSLPDAHGVATITRMVQAAGAAPVIVLTGNTDDEVAMQAVGLGADDYLLKSEITSSLIARTILYAIERRRGLERSRQLLALELARAQAARTAERARFLADLAAALADRLEPDELAAAVARYVVPELADFCVVDLVRGDRLTRVAAHARSPTLQAQVDTLLAFSPDVDTSPVARAVRERRTLEIPDVPTAIPALAPNAAHREAVLATGIRAAFIVPLIARGRVLGALSLAVCGVRAFDDDRRSLADEIARRTAVAIDTALLYGELRHAVRARDEMLAVVSHDLRNPLSVLALAIQTIERKVAAGAAPSAGSLTKARRAIDRMERLVDDLLDVARIDAGTLTVHHGDVDLVAVLQDALEQHGVLAAEKQVRLAADLPVEARVLGDRERLGQVVANLLGNAIKFTPADGAITVACAVRGDLFEVTVTDTGPGIAAESVPRVFDRFYQSERKRDGVGLGLAIAKGIVDAHGGTIGVDSAPGQGARFWFAIPARPRDALQRAAP